MWEIGLSTLGELLLIIGVTWIADRWFRRWHSRRHRQKPWRHDAAEAKGQIARPRRMRASSATPSGTAQ